MAQESDGSATPRRGAARELVARRLAALLDRSDQVITPWVRHVMSTWGLAAVFTVITAERTISAIRLGYVAVDLKIYRAAAMAFLDGGDPWRAGAAGLTFAAPPPTLIPYLPTALLPETIAIAIYAGLSIVAAVVVLRALHLPIWWLLFPPLAECLVVLNPDVFVIALLLVGRRMAFGAIVFKVYAAVPLILQRRWMAVVVGAAVCALSLPLVPMFIADRDLISGSLDVQSSGGLSAWGSWVMLPTIAALVILRHRGADWLAVPALWPSTQLHYSVLALPVAAKSPVTAFLLCFSVLYLPAVAAIILATQVVVGRETAPYRAAGMKMEPSASV